MEGFLIRDTPSIRESLIKAGLAALAIPVEVAGKEALAVSERTWKSWERTLSPPFPLMKSFSIPEERVNGLRSHVRVGLEGAVSDPPPTTVVDEIILRSHFWPELAFEYMARGRRPKSDVPPFRKPRLKDVFSLDAAGGHRHYQFRTVPHGSSIDGDFYSRFPHLAKWISSEGHRFILSAGGGGFRFAGGVTALKILDLLGIRHTLDEIWGTSAGAIMTFPFACGMGADTVEKLIYRYCYEPHPDILEASGPLTKKILALALRGIQGEDIFSSGMNRFDNFIQKFVSAVAREARSGRGERTIPFYTVTTNLDTFEPLVITRRSNTRVHLDDFIAPGSARDALQATASIPFLFPAKTSPHNLHEDFLVDGGLCENVPLLLPYLKWKRDLLHVEGTPKKLKLLALEVRDIPKERPKGKRASTLGWVQDVVNSSFYCNINLKFRLLSMEKDVEIIGIRIHLPDFSLLRPEEVHEIIMAGRPQVLEEFDRIEMNLALGNSRTDVDSEAS